MSGKPPKRVTNLTSIFRSNKMTAPQISRAAYQNIFRQDISTTVLADINKELASKDYKIALKWRHPKRLLIESIIKNDFETFRSVADISLNTAEELLYYIFLYGRMHWLVYPDLNPVQANMLGLKFIGSKSKSNFLLGGIIARDYQYTKPDLELLLKYGNALGIELENKVVFDTYPTHNNVENTVNLLTELTGFDLSRIISKKTAIINKKPINDITFSSIRAVYLLHGPDAVMLYTNGRDSKLLSGLIEFTDEYDKIVDSDTLLRELFRLELFDRVPEFVPTNIDIEEGYFRNSYLTKFFMAFVKSHKLRYEAEYRFQYEQAVLGQADIENIYRLVFNPKARFENVTTLAKFTQQVFVNTSLTDRITESGQNLKYLNPEILPEQIKTYGALIAYDDTRIVGNEIFGQDKKIDITLDNRQARIIRELNTYSPENIELIINGAENGYNTKSIYALYRNLMIYGSMDLFFKLESKYKFDRSDDLLAIALAKYGRTDIFHKIWVDYIAFSRKAPSKIEQEQAILLASQFVAKTLALAFLFNSRPMYTYILLERSLDITWLEEYLVEFVAAISEYSIDLLTKYAKISEKGLVEAYYLTPEFIERVKNVSPVTHKILQMYI